eukprot:300912_1
MDVHNNIVCAVGNNFSFEFGIGDTHDTYRFKELAPLEWSNNINIINILSGYEFTIYKDDKNKYYIAGNNRCGSCMMDKNNGGKSRVLSMINGLHILNVKNVYCNPHGYQGFMVSSENKLYGFGHNQQGQLGVNNYTDMHKLVNVKWEHGIIKQIQCADNYSTVLTQNGDVYSSGGAFDRYGGNGHENASNTWRKISELKSIKTIASGSNHTLCCDDNGNVYSFGANLSGQLGINPDECDNQKHYKPTVIKLFQQKHIVIVNISCGYQYSICLSENGRVYSFGYNTVGQCGQGYKSDKPLLIPTQIQSLNHININTIICGYHHSSIVSDTNKIYLFGNNNYHECVIDTYDPSKHHPILINEYVYQKYKMHILLIQLGYNNTKLILSNHNSNKINTKDKDFGDEQKFNETKDNNDNKTEIELREQLKAEQNIKTELKQKLETEKIERLKFEMKAKEMEQKLNELQKLKQEKEEKDGKEIQNKNNADNGIILSSLLKKWNLEQYIELLVINEGFEHLEDVIDLPIGELRAMGFKYGHAKKLKRKKKKKIN